MCKRLILGILIFAILCQTVCYADERELVVSEYKDVDRIWELTSKYSPNDYITAGIVSTIIFESNCVSYATGGGYLVDFKDIPNYDVYVTEKIDEGLLDGSSRDDFVKCKYCYGYGLLQWVEPVYLESFYDYAHEWGTSIGDAEMQVSFIFYSIEHDRPEVLQMLLECETAGDAGRIFAKWYEGTCGEKLDDRWYVAEQLYKTYILEGETE